MLHFRHSCKELLSNSIQVYPIAHLEFIQDEDGKRRRIGPMGEKEEMAARDAWQVGTSRPTAEYSL